MIESIKIKLGDREIDLTLDEARELKSELDKIFERPVVTIGPYISEIPYIITYR